MELRQLRYFMAVCEEGSINRAARLLNVAQPAVSRQIAELESELGTVLLDRSTRGVHPTRAGRQLAEMAESVLRQVEEIAVLFGGNDRASRFIAIGLPPAISRLIMAANPSLLSRLNQGSKVRITDGTSHRLESWVRSGELSFAVVTNPSLDDTLSHIPLWQEPLYVVGMGEAPWPRTTTLRSLQNSRLVLTAKEDPVRAYLEGEFRREGVEVHTDIEIEAMPSLLTMVRTHDIQSILPLSAFLGEYEAGVLRASRVEGLSISRMVIRRTSAALSRDARTLIQALRNELFDAYVSRASALELDFELARIAPPSGSEGLKRFFRGSQ